jgi:CheY-like chemotaxis protein
MSSLDVLVIDDNKTTRDMLRTLLEFEGHNVSCCANGKSGLELIKSRRFEIIVTDYLMPEMNGDEVTKLARRFSPDSFIIGCSIDAKARQFVDAGAHAFLSKDRVIYQLASLIELRAFLHSTTNAPAYPAEYRGSHSKDAANNGMRDGQGVKIKSGY